MSEEYISNLEKFRGKTQWQKYNFEVDTIPIVNYVYNNFNVDVTPVIMIKFKNTGKFSHCEIKLMLNDKLFGIIDPIDNLITYEQHINSEYMKQRCFNDENLKILLISLISNMKKLNYEIHSGSYDEKVLTWKEYMLYRKFIKKNNIN